MSWPKSENTFENVTRKSYTLCNEITYLFLNRLMTSTRPEVQAIGDKLEQSATDYMTRYDRYYRFRLTESSAETRRLQETQLLIQQRMPAFEKRLFVVLEDAKDMNAYYDIFPNGRFAQYSRGTQAEIRENFEAFVAKVQKITYPGVAEVLAEAEDLLSALSGTAVQRIGSNVDQDDNAAQMEAARKQVCVEMFRAFGGLIVLFPDQQELIDSFIPVELLTRSQQVEFTSSRMDAATSNLIFTRTYEEDAELRLRNLGVTELQVFRTERNGGAPGSLSVTLNPNEERIVQVSELGTGRFYYIRNLSATGEGAYNLLVL